ncbi:Tetratricopeptide TPR_2 [Paraglaciecola sp. T6c]|uniref:multiheme c-type cytochrome n=1 Tax=Pseudoalteromonas atlantica (strain T6c / ATCC BAA-1087) TaxID=3042615 RepID=UPI00005C5234|nr:multiheme c-type cytochrome [Paraglaciecola sp. T6c]ABG39972.1 Tetratricopeptide TPR_2 [Paraglaciecola sp. T6c]
MKWYAADLTHMKKIKTCALLFTFFWSALLTVNSQAADMGEGSLSTQVSLNQVNQIAVAAASQIASKIDPSQYAGAQACQGCHQSEYDQWQQSDHFKAMQTASKDTVLGDFGDIEVRFHDIATRFFIENGEYKITTTNKQNKVETFDVPYTFGFYPLQQYLIDVGEGKLQAFNIAWDSRSEEEGGQRWYHLQPIEKITPEHPFFWQRHFQNWNSRCADCHTTDLKRNFEPKTNAFDTQFSEVNVACESCHGPAGQHIKLAKSDSLSKDHSGFSQLLPAVKNFAFSPNNPIAHADGKPNNSEVNVCARCHSLRTPLSHPFSVNKENDKDTHGKNAIIHSANQPQQSFVDDNRLEWIRAPFYHANGSINEEVFVAGSFMQSKMQHAGVTCSNCHNAHTGKVKIQGNGLCLQCHQAETFNSPEHHHHTPQTEGAMCVNCHMPEKTYMGVDDRRDHSFLIPDLSFDNAASEPQSCLACHDKDDKHWRETSHKLWGSNSKVNEWKVAREHVQNLAPQGLSEAITYIQNPEYSYLRRASLLADLSQYRSQEGVNIALENLESDNALLRRAAVESLNILGPQARWQVLSQKLDEPSKAVRFEMARTLVESVGQLSRSDKAKLMPLLNEYRDMLAMNADSPITQLALGHLASNLGDLAGAEQAYLTAYRIEPSYIPVLIQVSEFYRQQGQDAKGARYLQEALQIEPNNAQANHALGLFKIRQKQYGQALANLKISAHSDEALPSFAYVYSVALDHQGQTAVAIKELEQAHQRWPADTDVLSALVSYLNKTGQTDKAQQYQSMLRALQP